MTDDRGRPWGVTALGFFFCFGVLMSGLTAISLLTPGGPLEPMWRIKPAAREAFATMGVWGPVLMIVVCVACGLSAAGIFTGRRWGYLLGIVMLVMNLIGDVVNTLTGNEPRAWIGVPIVTLILWYLSTARVRAWFREDDKLA